MLFIGKIVEENCKLYEVWIGFDGVKILDGWLFIFNIFKEYGYVMMFSEDVLLIGKVYLYFFIIFCDWILFFI